MSRAKREMDAKQNRAKRAAKPHNPFKKNKWVRMILNHPNPSRFCAYFCLE